MAAQGRSFMRAFKIVAIILSISFSAVAVAADFDGSLPLTCKVKQSHDCLRTEKTCTATVLEDTSTSIIGIDFAKKLIRSPLRKALRSVQTAIANPDSLVLQGSDQFVVW